MYLPESAAGAPGGRLAPAAQAKFQRPSSTAMGPLAHTDSARTVSTGGGLDIEFIIVMNPRMASRPRTGGMLGGSITPFTWYRSASESACPAAVSRAQLASAASIACLASALVSFGGGAAWQASAAASRMDRVWRGRIAYLRWGRAMRIRALPSGRKQPQVLRAPTHPSFSPKPR